VDPAGVAGHDLHQLPAHLQDAEVDLGNLLGPLDNGDMSLRALRPSWVIQPARLAVADAPQA